MHYFFYPFLCTRKCKKKTFRLDSFGLKSRLFFLKNKRKKKFFLNLIFIIEIRPFRKSDNYLLVFVSLVCPDFPSAIGYSSPMIRFPIHTLICVKIHAFRFTPVIRFFWKFKFINVLKLTKSVFKKIGFVVGFQN
jgi:hypothetical protein